MHIPLVQQQLLFLLRLLWPELDAKRIWNRSDLENPLPNEEPLEQKIARALRPYRRMIGSIMLLVFLVCINLSYGLGPQLAKAFQESGSPAAAILIALLTGMLLHGMFAFIVHEATHGNILGHPADEWVGNAALGFMLMPFAAESYQYFHRRHHRIPLQEGDPNWTPLRQKLFQRSRLLYVAYEFLPILNNLDRLREKAPRNWKRVLLSWTLAIATWSWFQPSLIHFLWILVGFNFTNALRLWTEHFGFWRGQISNLYYCPLSLGAGNHTLHHRAPKIPALALAVGVMVRRHDASMLTAFFHVLFSKDYRPFRTFQPDFNGENV